MMIKKQLPVLALSVLGASAIYAEPAKPTTPNATVSVTKKNHPELNIRYVNTLETMQHTKKGAEISGRLEKKRTELATSIQNKEKDITKCMQEFESKKTTLSTAAREKEESKIVKMRRDYESTVQGSEDELKLAMQRATEDLSKEIEETVSDLAKREGYDIVMDIYTGRTVYAAPNVIVTGDLVKAMDKKYETKLASNKSAKVTA